MVLSDEGEGREDNVSQSFGVTDIRMAQGDGERQKRVVEGRKGGREWEFGES